MGVIARALFLSLRAERSSLKAAEDEIASQAKRRARNDRPKGETARRRYYDLAVTALG